MFDSIDDVVAALRQGELVVITDDESRENEGDLIMAADRVTDAAVNFMATHGRGLICVPMSAERAASLALTPMTRDNGDPFGTAFTTSIDARHGISTGISAADRARTIRLLADGVTPRDAFVTPGHVFPLVARDGGVLTRPGHTEAAVDLARLAGCSSTGVICEIMNADGTMARLPDLQEFVRQHGLKWTSIARLVRYRQANERLLENAGSVKMPSKYSDTPFDLHAYVSKLDGKEHVALVYGDVNSDSTGDEAILVRVHSECLTGDAFGSLRCDCGEQFEHAMRRIVTAGRGVLVYLRQEGRGIGLINKIKAYKLQEQGLDTVEANERLGFPADLRDYGVAAQILLDLGVQRIRLLTNNPRKEQGLREFGIEVTQRVPIRIPPQKDNRYYLQTKKERLGHLL